MIPLTLTLKNFLSYQNVSLDFTGLHTACICGSNGAGKSSLLEAITWVVWGKCRADSEDDVLHNGTDFVRVDFEFITHQQTYRIIRSRQRGKSSVAEFQVKNSTGFKTLSAKGLRATQDTIVSTLKLDYDTFTNSAYLRQGRADEFMLRRPSERKQILADLLKLDQYETLATRAKDVSREAKGKADQLDERLQILKQEVGRRPDVEANQQTLAAQIEDIQQVQEQDKRQLQQLQVSQNQRQTWRSQWTWQQQQCETLKQDILRLQQQVGETAQQKATLQQLLDQAPEILTGYQRYQHLQDQEKELAERLQQHQGLQQQQQSLEHQLLQAENALKRQQEQQSLRLEHLEAELKTLHPLLQQADSIQQGLEQLAAARQNLERLDDLQHRVSPLQQRRSVVQSQLDRAIAQLEAQLEQLNRQKFTLQQQIEQIPDQRRALKALDDQIAHLERQRVYLKRVEDKGQERRHFQERLQEQQRFCEKQLAEVEQKILLLETPDALCPLCEQELVGHHREHVVEKTQTQRQDLQNDIWIIGEQLTVTAQELQILRHEYKNVSQQLQHSDQLQQQYGQLEAALERSGEIHEQLSAVEQDIAAMETQLAQQTFAEELQQELAVLEAELQQCQYDEQTHALARAEVDKLRKVEYRYARLKEAQQRHTQLTGDRPQLETRLQQLAQELTDLPHKSPLSQRRQEVLTAIQTLGYDGDRHQQVLTQLRDAQSWQLRHQEMQNAQTQLPVLDKRLQEFQQRITDQEQALKERETEAQRLATQMNQYADHETQIQQLEHAVQQRRQQLDGLLSQKGGLEQLLLNLTNLQGEYEDTRQQFQQVKRQYRVHQELSQAFGKNGIQAMMIENVLPQLEAETNQILARLTGNQLHIQFVTQRASKSSSKRKPKMIDTLDILIADAQGTRPYETYSGGEAFRINFSIRLALAKLLALRSGTALQLLIIDEGFGTQDADGCDRLIAAITAIATDFACILTVTHMPQFKEAFQQRIEVHKTDQGSQLTIIS